MPKSSAINLLKAKTGLSPQLLAIEEQLRMTSLVVLVMLFLTGIFFGVGYTIIRGQYTRELAQKETYVQAISRELRKEGLFTTLKDRIGIAGRIIEGQHAWLGVLDLINRLTQSGNRTSFAVNENDEVNLTITSTTLEETFRVVERILTEVAEKTVANPILESVEYQKDGSVRMTILFTPIF
ncbi:hypothetical protein HY949_05305 [Candidatus Gottesmanbacteria bacterium]|nr:hypothetical protein [Candidatus Gottesmanbacteria bacterium]